jgi:hypothetical protein
VDSKCPKCIWGRGGREKKQRVCVSLPFTLKSRYLQTKEELGKLKYFTMQKYNLQKIL